MKNLRQVCVKTNKKWADKLGIPQATAITCVKPSGNVSQLVDCSSGIHPRYSKHYIRTAISDKKDPLGAFMIEQKVPYVETVSNYIFQFPVKSPAQAMVEDEVGAMRQLKLWKMYYDSWCDHNPSQTIYYNDDNFLRIGQWVWDNFDNIGGLSFFPKADHIYVNPPYTKITQHEYDAAIAAFPKIDWSSYRELEDNTTSTQELACVAGNCEI